MWTLTALVLQVQKSVKAYGSAVNNSELLIDAQQKADQAVARTQAAQDRKTIGAQGKETRAY